MNCFSLILFVVYIALCSAKIVRMQRKGSPLFKSGGNIVPGEDGCQFLPEIVFVQDISTSFEDDMKNMAKVMPDLFDFFNTEYEGKVRFSIVSFVDKNVSPFGFDSDFCANVDMPLTPFTDEAAIQKAQDVFSNLFVAGGSDWLEGANEAMYRAASSSSVGWTTETHDPETGFPILRILVLVSDAAVHEAGFHAQQANLELPAFNLESKQSELDDDINLGCGEMDYPTPEDIRYALTKRNIVPIILTGVNYMWTPAGTKQMIKQFKEVMKLHGEEDGPWADLDTGLASYYESFLTEQVRMDGVVQIIDNSSSNFIEVFKEAMSQVTDLTCVPVTTTTEDPGTSTTEQYVPTVPQPTRPPRPTTESVTTAESTITNKPTTKRTTAKTTEPKFTTAKTTKPKLTTTKTTPPKTTIKTLTHKSTTTNKITTEEGSTTTEEGSTTTEEGSTTTESSENGNASTTTTTEEPTTTSGAAGGGAGVIIGGAAGGAAAGVAAAGVIAAKKLGLAGFGGSSAPDATILQDVENVEVTQDREQFEDVTGDLFN